ncbi:MAG: hypothetical protein QOH65_3596 [Methylobacteriaceae bacterium]|jgi:hypothetical protein|nr:hypothetical protein [Methylobacteriaceae bacterium]
MNDSLDPLILDFLEWVGPDPRPYAEVMEAWRTSCPRLTVFEDSIDRGFVVRADRMIAITAAGRDFLRESGRMAPGGSRAAPSREESRGKPSLMPTMTTCFRR